MAESPEAVSSAVAAGETDEQLMVAFAEGEANAFDRLYARYKGAVYRFFLRQLTEEDAQEAHQDTWMKVINARAGYEPRSPFRRYLFTIAHNVLKDCWRRRGRTPPMAEPPALETLVGDGDPLMDVARAQQVQQFYTQLQALPPLQREAFLLREEGGLSNEQIASVTGVGVETVRSRLRYAVAKMKEGLARHEQSH